MDPLRARRPRGFSLIEVLIAVIVSAVGFAAVFALQIRTLQGNISAREQSAAMVLAESGMESLRQEGYRWRSATLPAGMLSADARVWHTLSTRGPVDHTGMALAGPGLPGSELSRQRFCVHYWLEPMVGTFDNMLNVRVRVLWPRATNETEGLAAACSEAGADAFREDVRRWNTLMLPGALRMRE